MLIGCAGNSGISSGSVKPPPDTDSAAISCSLNPVNERLNGVVIAEIGIAAAFAANAVSYIAFQISLAKLRDLPPQPIVERQNAIRASIEAYAYASNHPGIGPMLLLFVVTTIGTRGFIEMFPLRFDLADRS